MVCAINASVQSQTFASAHRRVRGASLVRWWPTVGDTLDDSAPAFRRPDGSSYAARPKSLGVFANVNLGWNF